MATYELGFNAEPYKGNMFKLSGFYTRGEDVVRIVNNVFKGKPNTNDNLASLTAYGFQVGESQKFDNGISVDFNYTYTQGEQDSEDLKKMVRITNAPKHMIKSNLQYSLDQFTFILTGRWFDNINTHESNLLHAGKPMHGAAIFDSNIHYSLPLHAAEFSVDLGVTNLLDTPYYNLSASDSFANIPLPDGTQLSGGLARLPQETRRLYFTIGLSY